MDADAPGLNGMVNASFYSHYPLKDHYEQNKKPTIDDLKKKGYISTNGVVKQMAFVLIYMGDYDSAAWMNRMIPDMWKDSEHGKITGTWAFNPNLDYRIPHVFDYVRTHKASNDWFMSGDSGAGYLNPGMLLKKNRKNGLPDAMNEWTTWNKKYFKKFDLAVTGFIIDGSSPGQGLTGLDAYKEFSPVGIVGQKLPKNMGLHKGMPYIRMATDLPNDAIEAGKRLAGMIGIKPVFLPARTILKTPTWHKRMMDSARMNSDCEIAFVDPYTFFTLLKIHIKSIKNTAGKAKKYVYWSHGRCDELSPISFNDGVFEIKEYDNVKTIYQPSNDVQYIYFQIENGFAKKFANGKHDAEVQITLFDNKKGKVGITYDGIQDGESKAYIDLENYKYLKGKKRWTKITFKLKTPLFEHRENGNTDFRLINFGTDLIIKDVKVILK